MGGKFQGEIHLLVIYHLTFISCHFWRKGLARREQAGKGASGI